MRHNVHAVANSHGGREALALVATICVVAGLLLTVADAVKHVARIAVKVQQPGHIVPAVLVHQPLRDKGQHRAECVDQLLQCGVWGKGLDAQLARRRQCQPELARLVPVAAPLLRALRIIGASTRRET